MAGPQQDCMTLQKLCPARLLGSWDGPGLSSPGPFFGSSCLCSWAWPHLAGSPLSSLGNQGSLCVQTPSSDSCCQLLDGRHRQGALRQGACALDTQPSRLAVPRGNSPRAGHRGPATALSTGSPKTLSPSHGEEAPGSSLQLRWPPLEVRAGVPQWPGKKPTRISNLDKQRGLAHTPFQWGERPRSCRRGPRERLDTWESRSGSREASVVWDPPLMHQG